MFKLNSGNKFNIPSANLQKLFTGESTKLKKEPINEEIKIDLNLPKNNPLSEVVPVQPIPPNAEFENLVRDKLSKLDEVLLALQEKQDLMNSYIKDKPNLLDSANVNKNNVPVINTKLDKVVRSKKTYYNITDNMWNEIKTTYPELPDTYRVKTYSDGTQYYIDAKNKKIPLDNKALLKILNMK